MPDTRKFCIGKVVGADLASPGFIYPKLRYHMEACTKRPLVASAWVSEGRQGMKMGYSWPSIIYIYIIYMYREREREKERERREGERILIYSYSYLFV